MKYKKVNKILKNNKTLIFIYYETYEQAEHYIKPNLIKSLVENNINNYQISKQ